MIRPVAEDYGPVEGQTRLRTIPIHELVNGVRVAALGVGAGQAIEYGGSDVLQIGQLEDLFGSPSVSC